MEVEVLGAGAGSLEEGVVEVDVCWEGVESEGVGDEVVVEVEVDPPEEDVELPAPSCIHHPPFSLIQW